MGDRVTNTMQRVMYKGKSILLVDFVDVDMLALSKEIQSNRDAVLQMGKNGNTELLILTDISSVHIDVSALTEFKSVADAMRPYTKGSAIVGVHGIRKFMLDAVNQFAKMETKAFHTLDEGMEWLVSL